MISKFRITNLYHKFEHQVLFDHIELEFPQQKITAIFGPNGCGKSTLLNFLSGQFVPQHGRRTGIDVSPDRMGYIFQNYRDSLLPWETNYTNVALPLILQRKTPEFISAGVSRLQTMFNFDFDYFRYPHQLSGGQQQMLAFMRALITNPQLLLIDEPFSALDYENNLKFRNCLLTYYRQFSPTVILVTHNIEEAVHLASRIMVFTRPPTRVYKVINNPIAYPRDTKYLKSERFHQTKDKVLTAFISAINI